MSLEFIIPEWPAPRGVRALTTTRSGGISSPPYASLNLGDHVGDDPAAVRENRQRLRAALHLAAEPRWLEQVHGTHCCDAGSGQCTVPADAQYTNQPGVVCAVLTADCLPVLLCDVRGQRVAAVHAGWRGLLHGVIENSVQAMGRDSEVLAWLGPAIGPTAFEVGPEVREAFLGYDPAAEVAFRVASDGKWLADLYQLARQRLARCGIAQVYGGEYCTYRDTGRFFSYRRDGQTGRMATLIWREQR